MEDVTIERTNTNAGPIGIRRNSPHQTKESLLCFSPTLNETTQPLGAQDTGTDKWWIADWSNNNNHAAVPIPATMKVAHACQKGKALSASGLWALLIVDQLSLRDSTMVNSVWMLRKQIAKDRICMLEWKTTTQDKCSRAISTHLIFVYIVHYSAIKR